MISNEFKNSLKFSRHETDFNPLNGILNQNPIILTKKEAFNFNYTDTDKLRLAQLLVKRDLRNIREIESNNTDEPINGAQIPQATVKPDNTPRINTKKKPIRERVSSLKRVPGPQTPNKIPQKKNLPIRSMSPPTRDTDPICHVKTIKEIVTHKESEMENLSKKLEKCTQKLDGLEQMILAKSQNIDFNPTKHAPVKSNRDLSILSNKLHQLMRLKPITRPRSPPPQPEIRPNRERSSNIDTVLNKLDNLESEMERIRARWVRIDYETVSVYSQDNSDDETANAMADLSRLRFTRPDIERWRRSTEGGFHRADYQDYEDFITEDGDGGGAVALDMPIEKIRQLDKSRRSVGNNEQYEFRGFPVQLAHLDWMTEDLVEEFIDEVVQEINEINNQLVESIVNAELIE